MNYIFSVLQDFLLGFFIGAVAGCVVVFIGVIVFKFIA